ncbi:Protein of unknown function [Chitinophaga rupis]|uniref:DUF2961 domain-containing protein n=1 Tax=Chitinophaga rupis TaxID=573321 RepID=A0A1H7RWU5_9BACT|nr:glycoside hydrolase family 172 protein [Chitinophaga rupis]SEL64499.1 Protein of unknown function [Chitinophaga rupis]
MKWSFLLLITILMTRTPVDAQGNASLSHKLTSISLSDELKTLYDIADLPAYRQHTVEEQVSTYDLTGGNDDGFRGTYSYISRRADSSLVIADISGCGVINRIWTPTPTEDTLDFYIDDTVHAALSIKYSDLFSGKIFPFVKPLVGSRLGGWFCYFPIPFQKRCLIVCRGKKLQFHQIQYRLYPKGTTVKKFSSSLSGEDTIALKQIATLWGEDRRVLKDFYRGNVQTVEIPVNSVGGSVDTVFNMREGGRILGIEMDPANAFAGMSKNMDIKITWDNEDKPGVYCPIPDFFGYAFGEPGMHSLLIGTQDNRNYCYFPMPFDKSARIEIINREASSNHKPEQFKIRIFYTTQERDAHAEGRFYSFWRTNKLSTQDPLHVLLQAAGRGHYVGTILQAQGLRPGMTSFFEGDDSTATDGYARMHGTGSEDYFNGGWYACPDRWDSRQSLPLHGALEYSLPLCRTGGYRLFLSDKIPFEKNIFQSIEHGLSAKGFPVDYTSLSFYYGDRVNASQQPTNELTRIVGPDTLMLYPQMMKYTIWGSVDLHAIGMFPIGGRSCIYSANDESRLKVFLDEISPGKYTLFADLVKYPSGCSFSVWQGQTQVSQWINTNQTDTARVKLLPVCDLEVRNLPAALNSMTVTFRTLPGKNGLFLNRFVFVRRVDDSSSAPDKLNQGNGGEEEYESAPDVK